MTPQQREQLAAIEDRGFGLPAGRELAAVMRRADRHPLWRGIVRDAGIAAQSAAAAELALQRLHGLDGFLIRQHERIAQAARLLATASAALNTLNVSVPEEAADA